MTPEQWNAIRNNDKTFDGQFCWGLKTTGIVCRPSCSARKCLPQNVVIFSTFEEAALAGFRPCRRCRPDLPVWEGARQELAQNAKKFMDEHYREKFSLDAIASELFVNKSYLERAFKSVTGQTLLEYYNILRCEKAKELLLRPELTISFISSEAGFCSSAHFSRVFKKIMKQSPSEYRQSYYKSLTAAFEEGTERSGP